MNELTALREILGDLLDMAPAEIQAENYLVRDLAVESIDLLEIAVYVNSTFGIEVNDDELFLRSLRVHLTHTPEAEQLPVLQAEYPHLPQTRLTEILGDLEDGPVLQVRDLVDYIQWKKA